MGKRYLNSHDQQNVFLLSAIHGLAKDKVNDDKEKNKTFWKYIATYSLKAVEQLINDKDPAEQALVLKRSEQVTFGVFTKDKYIQKQNKEIELGKMNVMTNEDLTTLCKSALASCAVCDSEGEDVDNCPTRKVLIARDIEPMKNHGYCPYRVKHDM